MKKEETQNKIVNLLKLLSILFVLCSFLTPLAPAITMVSGDAKKTYGSAYSFLFGGIISSKNASYSARSLSVISLVAWILLLLGFLLFMFSYFVKKRKVLSTLSLLLVFVLFITSSILFLCSHKILATVLADALIKGHSDAVSTTVYNNSRIEFGIWGTSMFGFLAAATLFVSLIIDNSFYRLRARIGF